MSRIVLEGVTVYDYNRHGIVAFMIPFNQLGEFKRLAELRQPLTLEIYSGSENNSSNLSSEAGLHNPSSISHSAG